MTLKAEAWRRAASPLRRQHDYRWNQTTKQAVHHHTHTPRRIPHFFMRSRLASRHSAAGMAGQRTHIRNALSLLSFGRSVSSEDHSELLYILLMTYQHHASVTLLKSLAL